MSQARVGRIVGLSLGGLWLAISMLAAIAMDATETGALETAALPASAIIQAVDISPALY